MLRLENLVGCSVVLCEVTVVVVLFFSFLDLVRLFVVVVVVAVRFLLDQLLFWIFWGHFGYLSAHKIRLGLLQRCCRARVGCVRVCVRV